MQAVAIGSWVEFAHKSPGTRRFLVFRVCIEMNSVSGVRRLVFGPGGL